MFKNVHTRKFALVPIIIVAAAVLLTFPASKAFLCIEYKEGNVSRTVYFDANVESLTIEFRHSVNKGLIREIYSLDTTNLKINLEQAEFENYGAGMPDVLPINVTMMQTEDAIILSYPSDPQEVIHLLPGREADHRIILTGEKGEDAIHIGKLTPYKPVSITLKRQSIVSYAIREKEEKEWEKEKT